MTSNIYEELNRTMEVRYCKEAQEQGGEKEERLVAIYEGFKVHEQHRGDRLPKDDGSMSPFTRAIGAAALVLGLLCLLLTVGIIVLYELYRLEILKPKNTLMAADGENDSYQYLEQEMLNQMCRQNKIMQAWKFSTGWVGVGFVCYYNNMGMKNWTESRKDCQSIGADLVTINSKEEQEFVGSLAKSGDYWIGLESIKANEWERTWEWKWVDNTKLKNTFWKSNVNMLATDSAKVFIGTDGQWYQATNGSKHWICQKKMN